MKWPNPNTRTTTDQRELLLVLLRRWSRFLSRSFPGDDFFFVFAPISNGAGVYKHSNNNAGVVVVVVGGGCDLV